MQIILVQDVESFTQGLSDSLVESLVAGANARASRVAPCLVDADDGSLAEARMILLGAVKRWSEAGAGAITQQGAGPFQQTVDTRQGRTGYALWPSEIADLASLCDQASDGAFTIDMRPDIDTYSALADRPDLWFQWVHPTPPGAP